MKRYAIIVAGGSGTRMGVDTPKQFLPLGQKPVLLHTLEAFYRFDRQITIILVLPQAYFDEWNMIAEQYRFNRFPVLIVGGETRFASVKNALDIILDDDAVVLVHDGVRPLVSTQLIKIMFDAVKLQSAVIPVLPLTSSVREKKDDSTLRYADRNRFVTVQTPQGFRLSVLKKAYEQPFSERFTDDASVVEQLGTDIHFVQGEPQNIKITTQADMDLAEFYLPKIKNH